MPALSPEETIIESFAAKGWTLATAESCTGGMISARLTGIPGASQVFLEGVCAYSAAAKQRLGVPAAIIALHGEVSAEVAESMAEAVRARAGADAGISVTGIAGPTGGTQEKPVGLVFIGLSVRGRVSHERHVFRGGRAAVRARATDAALIRLSASVPPPASSSPSGGPSRGRS